jgi:hypothetical protein
MGTCAAMLLGRNVWTRGARGWAREAPTSSDAAAVDALSIHCGTVGGSAGRDLVIVFEPDGLSHQVVETPNVRRAAFASLARVRSEHPVVASESIGWGIEPPEPGPGGAYATQIHSEFGPGLVEVAGACERAGRRLAAAWSAYTVAAECLRSRGGARAGTVLILVGGHVAIAAFGAKRSFRAWNGPMSEKDWRVFWAAIGEPEARPSTGAPHGASMRRGMVIVADGDPQEACPLWADLRATGRIEAVVSVGDFAATAARIPARHPANLVASFPRRVDLDRCLAACAVAFLLAAAAFGLATAREASRLRREVGAGLARMAALEERLSGLEANKRLMERLRREEPQPALSALPGVHAALIALASAVPETLTLTSLALRHGGEFEIGAMVVAPSFDPDGARLAFSQSGFKPAEAGGWSFDTATGRLRVRGRLGGQRP